MVHKKYSLTWFWELLVAEMASMSIIADWTEFFTDSVLSDSVCIEETRTLKMKVHCCNKTNNYKTRTMQVVHYLECAGHIVGRHVQRQFWVEGQDGDHLEIYQQSNIVHLKKNTKNRKIVLTCSGDSTDSFSIKSITSMIESHLRSDMQHQNNYW